MIEILLKISDCWLGKFTDQEGFGKGKFELLSKAGTSSAPGSLHSRLPSDTHTQTHLEHLLEPVSI